MSGTRSPGQEPSLSAQEIAVLRALVETSDKVLGRRELARRIGLTEVNERRCDSLLVAIRRSLGGDSIRTVRGRGWIISSDHLESARELLQQRGTSEP